MRTWRKDKGLLRAGVSSRKAKEGPLAKADNEGRKRSTEGSKEGTDRRSVAEWKRWVMGRWNNKRRQS